MLVFICTIDYQFFYFYTLGKITFIEKFVFFFPEPFLSQIDRFASFNIVFSDINHIKLSVIILDTVTPIKLWEKESDT